MPAPLKLTLEDKVGCTGILKVQTRRISHLDDDRCPPHSTHWEDGEDTSRTKDVFQCQSETGVLPHIPVTHHKVQARQGGSIGC